MRISRSRTSSTSSASSGESCSIAAVRRAWRSGSAAASAIAAPSVSGGSGAEAAFGLSATRPDATTRVAAALYRGVSATRVKDDLGRELIFGRPPRRVVSLVPSDTHSVALLGAGDRVVGRTRYCHDALDAAIVGGTKDVDAAAVLAL